MPRLWQNVNFALNICASDVYVCVTRDSVTRVTVSENSTPLDVPLTGLVLPFSCRGNIVTCDRLVRTWSEFRPVSLSRYTKPQSFADCIGNELPLGWEEAYDPQIGPYYINHLNQVTQIEDPRLEWLSIQEAMLREYLHTAQEALEAYPSFATMPGYCLNCVHTTGGRAAASLGYGGTTAIANPPAKRGGNWHNWIMKIDMSIKNLVFSKSASPVVGLKAGEGCARGLDTPDLGACRIVLSTTDPAAAFVLYFTNNL
ncbi:Protein kibra [Papilio xuthus]|uniref:Protein kibra n=1 Tax=Papilio xuthus TaxID=66420 RepID=A0A194PZR0_PAPXU|nr:Protein kibra [Papilio xuthus]